MKTEILQLREEARAAQSECDRAKGKLLEAVRNCSHRWGPTLDAHIYHASYIIPGDPPGTMGVDWRGPFTVEAKTDKRWKRYCLDCGEEQFTTAVRPEVIEHPAFTD
jgi:hypothetical protein